MKKDNNLNLIFSGLFFIFGILLFLLWYLKGAFTLPASIIFFVIAVILLGVNSKGNAKAKKKGR